MPKSLSFKRKRVSDGDEQLTAARDTADTFDNLEKGGESLQHRPAKRCLRIVTDPASLANLAALPSNELSDSEKDSLFDMDSLFDDTFSPHSSSPNDTTATSELTAQSAVPVTEPVPALRIAAPIPGLFFDPRLLLPEGLADDVMWTCIRTYFRSTSADQVMLFERAPPTLSPSSSSAEVARSGLPSVLTDLLATLSTLLKPVLPPATHALLFPQAPRFARQAILNLYWPGEGITPHVDLLDRYGDGIIGVSLGSGCVMEFARVHRESSQEASERDSAQDGSGSTADPEGMDRCDVYLPARSVIVMSGDARYAWTHGIERRTDDLVEDAAGTPGSCWLSRDMRLSITFRWLLPGADVVGGPDADAHEDV